MDCLDGYQERLSQEVRMRDRLNHMLGNYIGIAMNDPKHYPKEPFLAKDDNEGKTVFTTDEARERYVRAMYGRHKRKKGKK